MNCSTRISNDKGYVREDGKVIQINLKNVTVHKHVKSITFNESSSVLNIDSMKPI